LPVPPNPKTSREATPSSWVTPLFEERVSHTGESFVLDQPIKGFVIVHF